MLGGPDWGIGGPRLSTYGAAQKRAVGSTAYMTEVASSFTPVPFLDVMCLVGESGIICVVLCITKCINVGQAHRRWY
jgi:hypothetical protein